MPRRPVRPFHPWRPDALRSAWDRFMGPGVYIPPEQKEPDSADGIYTEMVAALDHAMAEDFVR